MASYPPNTGVLVGGPDHRHPGRGHFGGNFDLSAQIQGLDLGGLLSYAAQMRDYLRNQALVEHIRERTHAERLQEAERNRQQFTQAKARSAPHPYEPTPQSGLMNTAQEMASTDPGWSMHAFEGPFRTKWLPYAASLSGLQLPNGWDTYAKLAAANTPIAGEGYRQAMGGK